MKKNPVSKGFTLIELLIVIGIIALLATIILASLSAGRARADDTRRAASLKSIQTQAVDSTNAGATAYSAAFASGPVADKLQQLATLSNVPASAYDVRSDADSYVVVFPLATGGYWCIDSNNVAKKVDGRLNATGANSCDNVAASGSGVSAPTLTLSGTDPANGSMWVDCSTPGASYYEDGYTATDATDGNITANVTKGPIVVGAGHRAGARGPMDYYDGTITYSVTNSHSLTTTVTRNLILDNSIPSCGMGGGS